MRSVMGYMSGEIEKRVAALLSEEGYAWPEPRSVTVEQPSRMEHGDLATNVAMKLAPVLRRSPLSIAEALKPHLESIPLVDRVEVAPPGFLNFFLDWNEWAAFSEKDDPSHDRFQKKVVVEHTSINPNKAAHIGHLRNSCIGDTLARMLKRIGYRVEVHNYIDDLGNQVADTVAGLLDISLQGDYDRFGDYCWDIYTRVHRSTGDEQLKRRRAEILHALEEGNNNIAWIGTLVAEKIVHEHLEDMARFGIGYDLLVWESDILREGFWAAAFEKLKQSPLFRRETEGPLAGCWVLKQPDAGEKGAEELNPDKVLVRSNGVLTYTAKDIAYHLWKFGLLDKDFRYRPFAGDLWTSSRTGESRPFGKANRVLNVIDRRQEYPQRMVKVALETLGFEEEAANLHHISYGVVSLSPATAAQLGIDTTDGRPAYPMSGRQGIGIKINELLDRMEAAVEAVRPQKEGIPSREIAAAAIRYYLLRFNLGKEIVFDIDQAVDLQGNSGVYLMYQHARASAILREGEALLKDVAYRSQRDRAPAVPENLSPSERALLRHLALWPDTLETATEELNPTAITAYTYELASLFSSFYNACPVLRSPEPLRSFRLWLTARTRSTLADALHVIGLPAPERM